MTASKISKKGEQKAPTCQCVWAAGENQTQAQEIQTPRGRDLICQQLRSCAVHMNKSHTPEFSKNWFFCRRLFGPDDEQNEEADSDRTKVPMAAQPFPSYAATAALPASGPVTATLTGS